MLHKNVKATLLILFSLFFISCDGGGSSNDGGFIPLLPKVIVDFSADTSGLTVAVEDKSVAENCTITAYEWDFGDGSAVVSGATASHTYAKAGSYDVTLTLTDNFGLTRPLTKVVSFAGSVTPDFTYTRDMFKVMFTDKSVATGSTIKSYLWEFGDGTTSPDKNPVHTYPTTGTYIVTLTVTDDADTKFKILKDVTVSVANITSVGFTSTVALLKVTFTNTSVYGAGEITSWAWDFSDGKTSPQENPNPVTYSAAGTYAVTLTATDKYGLEHKATANVTISPADVSSVDFTYTVDGVTATFTNTSVYGAGEITSWAWDFSDGKKSTLENPDPVAYSTLGTYAVTLTATDKYGKTYPVSKSLQITMPDIAPDFSVSADGITATFTDTTVAPQGVTISQRVWDFGDTSPNGSGASLTHIYAAGGIYKVKLTVTDNFNRSYVKEEDVTVSMSAAFSYTVDKMVVTFANESNVGSGTTYSWDFGDGTVPSSEISPKHTYANGGKYPVTLTATSAGVSDTFTASVGTDTFKKLENTSDGTTLALTHSGDLYIWGTKYLGMPDIKEFHTPQRLDIGTGEKFADIAAGDNHLLAVTEGGKVYAWGYNGFGQLGMGDGEQRDAPTPITGFPSGTKIISISAGYAHTLALTADGKVYAWGYNGSGQLGLNDNDIVIRTTPQLITTLSDIVSVSCGNYNSFAVDKDGKAWGWGNNNNNIIGIDETAPQYNKPELMSVGNLSGKIIKQIASIDASTFALTNDGTLYSWGNNDRGQLGRDTSGSNPPATTPTAIAKSSFGGKNIALIATSRVSTSSFAIDTDGNAWGWGRNYNGNLGDGTNTDRPLPVKLDKITDAKFIYNFTFNTFIIVNTGVTYATGLNNGYALGDGTNTARNTWVTVKRRGDMPAEISADFRFLPVGNSLELRNTSIVKHGMESYHWLINGETVNDKIARIPYDGVSDITATIVMSDINGGTHPKTKTFGRLTAQHVQKGANHTIAIADNGKVYAWGYNYSGNLGLGLKENPYATPSLPVVNLTDVKDIYAGANMSFAVTNGGELYAWGSSYEYNSGTGKSYESITVPTLINLGGETVKQISINMHALALTKSNMLYVWGYGYHGQLGLGNTGSSATPQPLTITGATAITKAMAGTFHSLAIVDGKVHSWGSPTALGRSGDPKIPALVDSPASMTMENVQDIAAGYDCSFMLMGGQVYAWGNNDYGQLGLGDTVSKSTPTKIDHFQGSTVTAIYADYPTVLGGSSTYAVTSDGKLWMWGSINGSNIPVAVPDISVDIEAGDKFLVVNNSFIVRKADGTLITWGVNDFCQLGLGDPIHRDNPTPLPFNVEK